MHACLKMNGFFSSTIYFVYLEFTDMQAYKREMLYPKYVWIVYGWFSQSSWTNANNVDCTVDQLRMVLEGGISVEVFPIPEDKNRETISGMVRICVHVHV